MITLSNSTMSIFHEHQFTMLADWIAQELKTAHPALCRDYTAESMLQSIAASIRRARAVGLESRRDFRLLAFLHLFVDSRYMDRRIARSILSNREISSDERVAACLRVARPRVEKRTQRARV